MFQAALSPGWGILEGKKWGRDHRFCATLNSGVLPFFSCNCLLFRDFILLFWAVCPGFKAAFSERDGLSVLAPSWASLLTQTVKNLPVPSYSKPEISAFNFPVTTFLTLLPLAQEHCFLLKPHLVTCGILVPQPGIEPTSSAVKAQNPNH